MSKAAKQDALEELHAKLARELADVIEKGEVEVDREGVAHRVPASAAILNVARQFLKDNDVKSLPTGDTPLERLGKAVGADTKLPFEGGDLPLQ